MTEIASTTGRVSVDEFGRPKNEMDEFGRPRNVIYSIPGES